MQHRHHNHQNHRFNILPLNQADNDQTFSKHFIPC